MGKIVSGALRGSIVAYHASNDTFHTQTVAEANREGSVGPSVTLEIGNSAHYSFMLKHPLLFLNRFVLYADDSTGAQLVVNTGAEPLILNVNQ